MQVRALRRKQLEDNGFFDKSLDKRVAAMQVAMAADPPPRVRACARETLRSGQVWTEC